MTDDERDKALRLLAYVVGIALEGSNKNTTDNALRLCAIAVVDGVALPAYGDRGADLVVAPIGKLVELLTMGGE